MCRSKHPFFLYKMKAPKSLVEVDTHTHAHAKRQLNYTSQFILIRKQTEQTRNEAKSSIWSTSQFALRSAALYVKLSSQGPRSQQQPWLAIQQRQHGLLRPPWAADGLPRPPWQVLAMVAQANRTQKWGMEQARLFR